jgi:hypothetical protein
MAAETAPLVVLCWETDPGYVPPFRLSPNQITVCVACPQMSQVSGFTGRPDITVPPGVYDLEATLARVGLRDHPALIVVWSSALGANMPTNLGAFHCPKLLICGDTHHMDKPIRRMLDYALAERFDAVASVYDRHHLHWFLAAGFDKCAWLPGISVEHVATAWQSDRADEVVFVGQTGPLHVYRNTLLQRVKQAGVPVRAGAARRAVSRELYARGAISFNCSLNGDLNMRVFEVLSAGGFLLTDRISASAGLAALLRIGEDYETYRDGDELLDKIAFYRAHPDAALRIAEHGAAHFRYCCLPELRRAELVNWMLDDTLPDVFNPRHDLRAEFSCASVDQLALRVASYEALQHRQQFQPDATVLIPHDWPVAAALDLTDLVRMRLFAIEPWPELRRAAAAAGVLSQLSFISLDAAARRDWDVVLTARQDDSAEPWRARAALVAFAAFRGAE